MAKADPSRWKVIDASLPPDMVQSKLQNLLLLYLSDK